MLKIVKKIKIENNYEIRIAAFIYFEIVSLNNKFLWKSSNINLRFANGVYSKLWETE